LRDFRNKYGNDPSLCNSVENLVNPDDALRNTTNNNIQGTKV